MNVATQHQLGVFSFSFHVFKVGNTKYFELLSSTISVCWDNMTTFIDVLKQRAKANPR